MHFLSLNNTVRCHSNLANAATAQTFTFYTNITNMAICNIAFLNILITGTANHCCPKAWAATTGTCNAHMIILE